MAKVTVTIEDSGEAVDFKMTFEPELVKDEKPTSAQSIALNMLELLKVPGETNDS